MRRDFCKTSKYTNDNFVGIRFNDRKEPEVVFPHGYNIPEDEKELRKDVFRLLGVLQRFSDHREGSKGKGKTELISTFPIQSYQYLMQDFLEHGYYVEKETEFVTAPRGRISWKRTIQKEKPQLNDGNVVYLDFQVRRDRVNENRLITRIHKYCVYESFQMFGWLYFDNDLVLPRPDLKLNRPLFLSVLYKERGKTNNDGKKRLFTSMINVLEQKHEDLNYRERKLGVYHFASIWERLIDYVFGEDNIEAYFPKAHWYILKDGQFVESSHLEPDTIMKRSPNDKRVYVLDAKYYQYGITEETGDLPNTSSIQKQITYGRHVVKLGKAQAQNVYNAFVMPYQGEGDNYVLNFVAGAEAMWEEEDDKDKNYTYILGILLDTRHLITTFSKHNQTEIENLAETIEKSLYDYKVATGKIVPEPDPAESLPKVQQGCKAYLKKEPDGNILNYIYPPDYVAYKSKLPALAKMAFGKNLGDTIFCMAGKYTVIRIEAIEKA